MKIGRNFKPNSAEMVLLTISNMLFNEGNLGVNELSDRYVRNELVSRIAIKNVKVASSKLLWLFDQNTIIMDRNNMKVLKAKSYAEYVNIWRKAFDLKQIEIDKILTAHFKNLDKATHEKWFKMRVFDQYLLSIYSEQQKI